MSCPESERWQEWLRGSLAASERDLLEEHLGRCQSCRRTLVELGLAGPDTRALEAPQWLLREVRELPRRRSASRGWHRLRRRAPTIAVAAGVLLIAGLGWIWQTRTANLESVSGVPEVRALPELLRTNTLSATARIDGEQVHLSWSPPAETTSTRVLVLDPRGDIVVERTVGGSSLVLRAEDLGGAPGVPYYWYVIATLVDGTTSESAVQELPIP